MQPAAIRKLSVCTIRSWYRLIVSWIFLRLTFFRPTLGKSIRENQQQGRYLIDRGDYLPPKNLSPRSLDSATQSDLPIIVREILANSVARLTNSWFIGPFSTAPLRPINENLATATCRPRFTAIFTAMTYRRSKIIPLPDIRGSRRI